MKISNTMDQQRGIIHISSILLIGFALFGFGNVQLAHGLKAEDNKLDRTEIEAQSQLGDEECLKFGLNRQNLPCSSCNLLEKYELSELGENCLRCCNPALDKDIAQTPLRKYPKARLEVCWCKFPTMPQIEAFVKSDLPKKFPNLTIKHINGQSPIIKLMNEDGSIDQTLAINRWDTDTIVEFLTTYLEPESSSEDTGSQN